MCRFIVKTSNEAHKMLLERKIDRGRNSEHKESPLLSAQNLSHDFCSHCIISLRTLLSMEVMWGHVDFILLACGRCRCRGGGIK